MMKRQPVQEALTTELFQIPGTTVKMQKIVGPVHPMVPPVDLAYVFRQDLVEQVAFGVANGMNVMLVGETGVGKSTLIEQLAAQLNHPLTRINVHGESDTAVLIGRDFPTIVNGEKTLTYRWGPLPKAMVTPGHWFLLDEIDSALQPVLFVLQQMLERHGRLILEDADSTIVERAPGFNFFASGNTVGIGARHKLLYTGTNKLNEATLDRFDMVIHVPELDPKTEEEVIARNVPSLDRDYIRGIVRIAKEVREQLRDDAISCTFSTRRCIQWARVMLHFHPYIAARLTVLNKLGVEDYRVLEGVVSRFFGKV